MNLYGEYGNLTILKAHLEDQGFDVIVDRKSINDEIEFNEYDFIYMGAGTEKNQMIVLEDMKKRFKDSIADYIMQDKFILLTGNSYEIFGKRIGEIQGLEILNIETDILKKRNTSDIISVSRLINKKIVGFVNNMSSIKNNCEHFLDIEYGIGENKELKKEGVLYKGLIGTHLIGPLLVKNPGLLKYFVEKLCTSKNQDFKYNEIKYDEEEKAYEVTLKELSNIT